jgi:hypothetical protein
MYVCVCVCVCVCVYLPHWQEDVLHYEALALGDWSSLGSRRKAFDGAL